MSMPTTLIEHRLKSYLGNPYGGPSISWDDERKLFVMFHWSDAPPSITEVATGETLTALVIDFRKKNPGHERK